MPFDARAAKQLAPGAHLTIEEHPGLRLEATETRRTWTYRYRSPVDGRMRQLKLGAWPAMSFVGAAAEWEKLRARREAGEDPVLEKKQARQAIVTEKREAVARKRAGAYLVRDLCEDFLADRVDGHRKPKGAREVRRMFATMLGAIESKPAVDVARTDAYSLIQSFAGIPVQAGHLRGALGAAWDYGLDSGKLPDNTPNWWRQILRGRLKSKGGVKGGEAVGTGKRVLRDDEMAKLLPWLPNFSRDVADVVELYTYTLTRGSEIVAMHADEITEEVDGLWWTIPKPKTKNARHELATDLRVPLVGGAERVVRRRLAAHPGGYLFPAPRKSESPHIQQKAVQTAVWTHQPYCEVRPEWERPRLTVTHWSPHDLRRTGRTKLTALGCPDEVAEAVLGHMPEGVKKIYNRHEYDKERRVWLTRLAKEWERVQKAFGPGAKVKP